MGLIPAWVDGRLVPVEKLEVHRRGLRHKAVSVFLFAGDALLIQRRALSKYHSPGLWANTCCSHPDWQETGHACAVRRVNEELGLAGFDLFPQGVVEYRADVGGGLVEHELVDIFFARVPHEVVPRPDPREVMETEWADLGALAARVRARPDRFAPWLRIYMERGLLARVA